MTYTGVGAPTLTPDPTPPTDGPVVLLVPAGLPDLGRAALLERARHALGDARIVIVDASADPRSLFAELGELPSLVLDARDDDRFADVLAAAQGGDVRQALADAYRDRPKLPAKRGPCDHARTGSDGKGRPICLACGVRVVRLVVDKASGKLAGRNGVTLRTHKERPGKAGRKAAKRAKRDARRELEAANGAAFRQLVADAIDELEAGPTAEGMTEGQVLEAFRAKLEARPVELVESRSPPFPRFPDVVADDVEASDEA